MNASTVERPTSAPATTTDLKEIAADVVRRAGTGGATAAEVVAMDGSEFSTVVRLGEVETLKESGSKGIGVRVFFGQRAASTYSSDLTPAGVKQMVESALALARSPAAKTRLAGFPRLRTWANWMAISGCTTTMCTRSQRPTASIAPGAPRKPQPKRTRASSTPKAAHSMRPSASRSPANSHGFVGDYPRSYCSVSAVPSSAQVEGLGHAARLLVLGRELAEEASDRRPRK